LVTSFPFGNELIESSFLLFKGTSQALIRFVPLILLLRLIITKAMLGGKKDYGEIFKDMLLLYVGFFVFQEIMELVMKAPQLAESVIGINESPTLEIEEKDMGVLEWLIGKPAEDLMKLVSTVLYWFVCFCYLLLMSLMIGVGAYIIFFATIFRMRWMMTAYFSLVLILSLWPFAWYTIDQAFLFVVEGLRASKHNTGVVIAQFLGGTLKLLVPLLGGLAALRMPAKAGSAIRQWSSEGSKPIRDFGSASGRGVAKVGEKLGVNTAMENFRKDPVQSAIANGSVKKDRKLGLSDTAPLAVHLGRRASTSLKGRLSKKEQPELESYKQHRENMEKRSHQRAVLSADRKLNSGESLSFKKREKLTQKREKSLQSLERDHNAQKVRSSIEKGGKIPSPKRPHRPHKYSEKATTLSKRSVKGSAVRDERFLKSIPLEPKAKGETKMSPPKTPPQKPVEEKST